MLTTITKILNSIGLNDKEGAIVGLLLESGKLRASEIASRVKLNRTTAYGILKNLLKKGLVTSFSSYGITEYQSIEPTLLPSYIERQEQILQKNKEEFKRLVPSIQKMREQKNIFPSISFFEGIEGLKQAYEDTIENNTEKIFRDFTGPDAMFEIMDEKKFVEYYVGKRVKLGVRSLSIFPDTKWSRYMKKNDAKELRETRLIPKKYAFDTGIVIYDNKVSFFSYSPEKPMAVIIEDKNISQTMKTLFNYINDGSPSVLPTTEEPATTKAEPK